MKNLIFLAWGVTLCFCLYQTKTPSKPTVKQLRHDHCPHNVIEAPEELTGCIVLG